MKNFKLACLFSCICFLYLTPGQAQIIDSFPWFKAPSSILTPKIMDWNTSYNLVSPRSAIQKSSALMISSKKIKIPSDIKLLKGPITLKRGKSCYQVGCDRNKECNNCQMFWKDLNRDRKIQPRKELRCVCPKSGDNCSLSARKIECK